MFDTTNLKRKVSSFDASPQFDGYTKVDLIVSENQEYISGDDAGRVLTVECPWGTQVMADNILALIKGYQYQPYTATGAHIDPAAELGDGVTIDGLYSGIFSETINFSRLYTSDIEAPGEEEIDHEFQFTPAGDRRIERRLKGISSSLTVQAEKIEAKVEKTSGENSSFGWVLENDQWRITANGGTVLKADKNGLEVKGRVTAISGKIGGFDIINDHISFNNAEWGGSNARGVYIGPEGIQLGTNFSVDAMGNLKAFSGEFKGSVQAGHIQYGGKNGYFNGAGLSTGSVSGTEIGSNTISVSNTDGGINASLGYANFSNSVFNGYDAAGYVSATYGYFTYISMDGHLYKPKTTTIKDGNGAKITIYYLGRVNY